MLTSKEFVFLASDRGGNGMTAALISSSTAAPDARRVANAAVAGDADGLAIEALPSASPDARAAVITMSAGGVVRTATVADILTEPFLAFRTLTSPDVVAELATMARRADGPRDEYAVAYREGGPLRGVLVLQQASGTAEGPSSFVRPEIENRPALGERIRILDVPGQGFVLAYEERQVGGRLDVRLLWAADYGSGPGFAPMPLTASNRRLEDAGLVERGGELHVALAITRLVQGAELTYLEVPIARIARDGRGEARGVVLDFAVEAAGELAPRAQLGCRRVPAPRCTIAWLGGSRARMVYLRL